MDGLLVTSRQNPRIVAARKLRERKERQRQRRFLVEGVKLLAMALEAGARPREVFFCPAQADARARELAEALQAAGGELVAVSPAAMESLAERQAAEGVLATFDLFEAQLDDLRLADPALVLVLDRLQDPGNLGTLLRTADAVGAAAAALIEPCVDPFDPKVVRGSMGSLFHVPLVRTADVVGLFAWLRAQSVLPVGAHPRQGAAWGEGVWQRRTALVLGSEAHGLSADVAPHVAAWARLPLVGRAESLNVAVAGGVLMYAWLRSQGGANLVIGEQNWS
ncbi:MAG: RNA methyltransferase [Caldilineales bacterium]|nr:RNA methyltransferase [Caldilineales bacterium]MDW8319600.1 RNA methyltransferase [Anaerolineae bacterium]